MQSTKNHEDAGRSVFVGRDLQLREIRHLLDRALSGETVLALITGEPGIGKTTLVEEAMRGEDRFPPALWSYCWADDGAQPYAPWIEILADLDGRKFHPGWSSGANEEAPESKRATARETSSLYQWVSIFRSESGFRGPRIVVLDDLHAADLPSLKLLERLARSGVEGGILFLATAREREIQRDLPRSEIFGKLLRIGCHIALEGFTDAEISELYSITAGRSHLTAKDLDQIESSTGRNPLLLRESIRQTNISGNASVIGGAVSLGTRVFLRERWSTVSPEGRELAGFLAVFGTSFPIVQVGRRYPDDSRRGLQLLGELEETGLVERSPKSPAEYRFVHDLFREAVSEELAIELRHALHLEIAEDLIRHGTANTGASPLIAFHLREALPLGSPDVMGQWAQKAAQAYMDAAGAMKAIEWLNLAIECQQQVGPGAKQSASLRKSLAEAYTLAGEDATAQRILLRLVEDLKADGDTQAVGEATLLLAHLSPAQPNADTGTLDLIHEALAGLDDQHSALRAGLLARSSTLQYFDDLPRCRALADDALLAAEASGDAAVLCYALMASRTAKWGPDAMGEQVGLSLKCLNAATACADDSFRFTAFHWIACDMLTQGTRIGIERLLGDWRKEAYRAIDRRPETLIGMIDATREFMAGRLESAREKTERLQLELEDLEAAEIENLYQFLGVQLFTLQREDGQLAHLEASVRGFVEQYPGLYIWRSGLALLLAETGRFDDAYQELEVLSGNGFRNVPRDGNWLATIANCAEVASLCGATKEARLLHSLLEPKSELYVVLGMGASCWGSSHHYLGLLEDALGQEDAAVRSFQRAIASNEAAGAKGLSAYSRGRLAELLCRRPETRERGAQLLNEVDTVARAGGSVRLATLVDSIRAKSVRSEPAEKPGGAMQVRRAKFVREGEYWVVAMDGAKARLRDRRGLGQLWQLLSSPGVDFLALELLQLTSPGEKHGSGKPDASLGVLYQHEEPIFDSRAFQELRATVKSVEGELAEAEQTNDLGRAEALRLEKEKLVEALASATGLGGRTRKTASPAEKARVNVTRTLRSAIAAIEKQAPSLGAYLDRHVETGRTCRYEPDPVAPVDFKLC